MKNKKIIIIAIVTIVIVALVGGIAAFVIIRNNSNIPTNMGNFNRQGGMGNFATVRGTVSSVDQKVIVVDSADNQGQRIVVVSDTTTIVKPETANKDDIVINGQTIIVQGERQDKTITAASISAPRMIDNMRPTGGDNQRNRPMGGPGGNNFFNGSSNTFIGRVTKIDNDQVTITAFDNTEYQVVINSNTKFTKQTQGSVSDLKVNTKVTAVGSADSSGSISARNITILPDDLPISFAR